MPGPQSRPVSMSFREVAATARQIASSLAAVLLLVSLAACATPGPPVETTLATANQPHGIVYFSLADYCPAGSAAMAIAYRTGTGLVPMPNSATVLTYKAPSTGLTSILSSYSTVWTRVLRFDLPPGSYVITALSCTEGRTTTTLYAQSRNPALTKNMPLGLAYFSVVSNEVVSSGALSSTGLENKDRGWFNTGPQYTLMWVAVRPFNSIEMQNVATVYPAEASKIVYRPAVPLVLPTR